MKIKNLRKQNMKKYPNIIQKYQNIEANITKIFYVKDSIVMYSMIRNG